MIEKQVRSVFQDAGTAGWLHAIPLAGTSREVDVDADEPVVMASVYKLPLLVALCREFDRGRVDPQSAVRINPASCTPGPTGISTFLDPITMSWRDLAASMMTVSDSAAADVILGEVGLDAVRDVVADLELPGTRIVGGTADVEATLMRETGTSTTAQAFALISDNDQVRTVSAYDPAYTSATTPRDMTRLLSLIWSDSVASAEQCAFIRRLMGMQVWPHRIRAGFPFGAVRVSGKTGTIGAVRNEVAVVEYAGEIPIAVAVFTFAARADLALPAVDAAIAESARIAVTDLRSGRL
ncbi:serine hydrolase [Kibdelosporangium persicum]|uniref:Beta-lactamase regulatory protein BlaB n=1 Tax=Kibdelosporangium persicum TaxID=2698649 RepID=A0ABX2FI77_9PSEU|nr:serine hydrolase [Kibdelosporangium persicum]NRN70938.1 Beta-lactamase regulatory protein BlaB [Kibdelosporangium persicum]